MKKPASPEQVFAIYGFEARWIGDELSIRFRNFKPKEETVEEYVSQLRALLELALDARPDLRELIAKREATYAAKTDRTVRVLEKAVGIGAQQFTEALRRWRAEQKESGGPPDMGKLYDIFKKSGGQA